MYSSVRQWSRANVEHGVRGGAHERHVDDAVDTRRDGRVHGRAVLRDAVDILARGHEQHRVHPRERLDHAPRVRVPGDDGDVRLGQRVVAQAGRAGGVAHHQALRRTLGGEPERELRPQEPAPAPVTATRPTRPIIISSR